VRVEWLTTSFPGEILQRGGGIEGARKKTIFDTSFDGGGGSRGNRLSEYPNKSFSRGGRGARRQGKKIEEHRTEVANWRERIKGLRVPIDRNLRGKRKKKQYSLLAGGGMSNGDIPK